MTMCFEFPGSVFVLFWEIMLCVCVHTCMCVHKEEGNKGNGGKEEILLQFQKGFVYFRQTIIILQFRVNP